MIEQGSDEWHAMRHGRVTASRIVDMMARTKSGWGAGRANYKAEIIAQRLTSIRAEGFHSPEMQWGTDTEPLARAAYEFERDVEVVEVPFVHHPTIEMAGASPDGLVGDDGLIEIKCTKTAHHIDTILAGKVPTKYQPQMQFQMACTGRAWCDFVSYDPRMPERMRLFIKRLPRDDERIAEIEKEARSFLAEIDAEIAALNAAYPEQK